MRFRSGALWLDHLQGEGIGTISRIHPSNLVHAWKKAAVGAVCVINGICTTNGASLGLPFAESESCGWSDGNNRRGDCESSGLKELSSAAYSGDELISYNM